MRRLLATAIAISAVLALLPAVGAEGKSRPPRLNRCHDKRARVYPLALQVEGELATGRASLPRKKQAKGLVVFAHGYGHTSYSWDAHMLEAARHGLIAVTMDYRGLQISPDSNEDGLPESRGWNAMAGAEDLIAAARMFSSRCDPEDVYLFGVSMGANMSGLALALAGEEGITNPDGSPLFDHWVDVEGAVNVVETYLEARAAAVAVASARNAQADIEAEMGGPIEQDPDPYLERTVVARVDDIAASGVNGIIAIHGLDDGLVPPNQSRELVTLTRAAGLPTEMITIGRRDEDSERETTITGYVVGALDPDYTSPLAGHASEKSTTHIVMQTALERLWSLVEGEVPSDRECLVNGQTPAPAGRLCSP